MEEIKIVIQPIPNDIQNLITNGISMDNIYGNILFSKLINNIYTYSDYKENDGFIYYSKNEYKLKRNKNGVYLKKTSSSGLTFNKQTNKLSIWFGKSIQSVMGLIEYKYAWCEKYTINIITNSILAKMLCNKISNNYQIIQQYAKLNRINIKTSIIYKMLKENLISMPTVQDSIETYGKIL